MRRKLIIVAICAILAGLVVYEVVWGSKKTIRAEPRRDSWTVVVETPKTNKPSDATSR